MNPHPGFALLTAVLTVSLMWWPGMIAAQDERKPFVVEKWRSEVGLAWDYSRDESRSRDGTRTVLERSIFAQLLGLDFEGYSFDRRLLRYRLDLDLEHDFLDETFEAPGETFIPSRTSTQGNRINYDLFLHFLPENRESLSAWARRRDYRLAELLFDRFEVEEEVYGAQFTTRWPVAPFSILVERRESQERGLFDTSSEETNTVEFDLTRRFGERARFGLEYEYTDRTRVTEGEMRSPQFLEIVEKSHRADAFLEYWFGRDRRSSSLTRFNFLDDDGTNPYRTMLGRERVVLYHSPSLQTDYGLTYQETDIGSRPVETIEAEVGLRHRLYDNFLSQLVARWRRTQDARFKSDDIELAGSWGYYRNTPWGRLQANYSINSTSRDSNADAGVSNQLTNRFGLRHAFPFPLRVYYRLEDQRRDNDESGQRRFAITDSTEHTVGYEVPLRRWRLYQEYDRLDDTLGLTESIRSGVNGYISLPMRSQLNLGLSYDDVTFDGRAEDSQTLVGQIGFVAPFGRRGLFEVDALYQDYKGIQDEAQWRIDSSLGFDWRRLKFRFTGKYGLFDNRRGGFERESVQLLFTVSRELR